MIRREFITLLGGVAAAWPRAARAQTKRARIGWFTVAPHPYIEGFRRGLKELGWIEGENVVIEQGKSGIGVAVQQCVSEADVFMTAVSLLAAQISHPFFSSA